MAIDEHLFAYGTLLDPSLQRLLFGAELSRCPAVIPGWTRRVGADGYLFIRPFVGERVDGQLLTLSNKQLAIADLWEEVPLYNRERVTVCTSQGERSAWTYARRSAEGAPFFGTACSAIAPSAVLNEAAAFAQQLACGRPEDLTGGPASN
jgi:gamma-glutamylcyclotransferase (GGCT)/AIG2-like uncharacterized protein YtfP